MPRPVRNLYPGAWYHVMNRGAARRDIFRDDLDRRRFLELLDAATSIHSIEIHAYCLMGNHYHLLVHSPDGNLDEAMNRVMSMYVREFNRRHQLDGPMFRGRYHATLVESQGYLVAVSRYIHRNPLDLGVTDLESYPWSSLSIYAGTGRRGTWVSTEMTLDIFGGRQAYLTFVRLPFETDVDREWSAGRNVISRKSTEGSPPALHEI